MRILIVHNEYGKFSGEEAVVQSLSQLLEEHGHQVHYFSRSSAAIPGMRLGNIRAFFSGIYSFSSRNAMRRCLREFTPDIVHVHNVFPLISPSVLGVCRRAGVPVVMTVHNYRLVCPNGLHMNDGHICEKCCGGREYHCLLNNCEGSYFKSLGYFLRNYFARKFCLFKRNVLMFACLTEFQRQRLIEEGFDAAKIVVIPNMVDDGSIEPSKSVGDYVGFVGRVSPEKGVDTLVEAARDLPEIMFKAAGVFDRMKVLVADSPENFEFIGPVKHEKISEFYKSSRLVVLPNICFEGFPMILPEAMLSAKPIIASRIGGIPEIVDDGKAGLLFEPGNHEDLARKIKKLWDNPELCRKMGQAGREKALREYSSEKYYSHLMAVYEKAIDFSAGSSSH